MSRHSFRSSVLRFIALTFIIDIKVNSFAIRSTNKATDTPLQDLAGEESLQLEVRHDFKRPNGIDGNVSSKSNEHLTTDNINYVNEIKSVATPVVSQIAATTLLLESYVNREVIGTPIGIISDESSVDKASTEVPKKKSQENFIAQSLKVSKHNETDNTDNSMTVSIDDIKVRAMASDESATRNINTVTDPTNVATEEAVVDRNLSNSTTMYSTLLQGIEYSTVSMKNNNNANTSLPSWKKYTVIDRKRVPSTVETKVATGKYEEMINAETRVTIKDSNTFDFVDIEKTTEDLLSLTLETTSSDFIYTTYNENIDDAHQIEITKKSEEQPTERLILESVFSKRAGFLNLSSKTKQIEEKGFNRDSTTENDNTTPTIQFNLEERTKSNFADEPGSQSYLDEDATKDVLLKLTSLNKTEGIAQQIREQNYNNSIIILSTIEPDVTIYDMELKLSRDANNTNTTLNSKLNQEKGKSTKIYTVNPNYKPMKKIDVQPPKSFVRDPDDNSWRNESISSLGIVFKPKNSSKPFTQVLKNKTETEWSNVLNRDIKNGVPDLKERLEKIAQRRKTKRKKADMFGNIFYTDYEESNSSEEIASIEKQDITSTTKSTEQVTTPTEIPTSTPTIITTLITDIDTTTDTITTLVSTDINSTLSSEINTVTTFTIKNKSAGNIPNLTQEILPKTVKYQPPVSEKIRKLFNLFDYYDIPDEDEDEYLELAKLELKKFTVTHQQTDPPLTTPPLPYPFTKTLPQYFPDRQPTIQYFPPRNIKKPKPNRFDNDFEKRIKFNANKPSRKNIVSITNAPDTPLGKYHSRYPEVQNAVPQEHSLITVGLPTMYKPNERENVRNLYQSNPQITRQQNNAYGMADHNEGFNRASYVIKNYRDFLDQGVKDYDYERDPGFVPYTEPPIRGVTMSDVIVQERDRLKTNTNFNYDYDAKFRKDVLQRFVDNFNQNEARYNADFPVLYNNSVMHVSMAGRGEAVASSRAFLKGLYNPSDAKLGYARREPYDPNCDKGTVELSPAYELHYYVPDQEEKEEAEPKQSSLPIR